MNTNNTQSATKKYKKRSSLKYCRSLVRVLAADIGAGLVSPLVVDEREDAGRREDVTGGGEAVVVLG